MSPLTSTSVSFVITVLLTLQVATAETVKNASDDTEVMLFNFTETLPLEDIWPSDGLLLQYDLIDTTDYLGDIYFVSFTITIKDRDWHPGWSEHWNSSVNLSPVTKTVALDVSNCNCISDYSCLFCQQHINLFKFMAGTNVITNDLQFTLSHNAYLDDYNVLITPHIMIMHLQRCNIMLEASAPKTTNDEDYTIPIIFNVSQNCYTRIGEAYIVDITAMGVDSGHMSGSQLTININDDQSLLCELCEINNDTTTNSCVILKQYSFTIKYTVQPVPQYYYSPTTYNDQHISIWFSSQLFDVYLPISMQIFPATSAPSTSEPIWSAPLILSVIFGIPILCMLGCCCYFGPQCWRNHKRYRKAYVVNKVLVLIIGISQFDTKKYMLDGVKKNIKDLVDLWKNQYKYDVFVCNQITRYCTKNDIIDFIDEQKVKLEHDCYQSVILHIISHGFNKGQSFLSSDHKQVPLEWIQHELTESAIASHANGINESKPLIKIIFNHVCRAENVTSDKQDNKSQRDKPQMRGISMDDVQEEPEIKVDYSEEHWEDSNWAVVWGTIKNHLISDDGHFTTCICDEFRRNVGQSKKTTFRDLITNIRNELQRETDGTQICEISETLSESSIRFEKNTNIHVISDETANAALLELPQRIN